MSVLEKIIFIADMIEPNRRFKGIEQLREKVYKDLAEGMKACIRHSIQFSSRPNNRFFQTPLML